MALSLYNSTGNSYTTNGGKSFSFDAGTGSNRLLIATVSGYAGLADFNAVPTYNSVSMTQIVVLQNATWGSACSVWKLIAPATGANTFAISLNNIAGGQGIGVAVYAFSGADQTTGIDTYTTASSSSATLSSIANANEYLVAAMGGVEGTPTVGSGGTMVVAGNNGGSSDWASEYKVATGTTNQTLSFGSVTAARCAIILVAVKVFATNYTLSVASGSYGLTGESLTPQRAWNSPVSYGNFSLSGFAATMVMGVGHVLQVATGIFSLVGNTISATLKQWLTQQKSNSPTFANQSKNSASFTTQTRNATSFTIEEKSTTTIYP